MKASIQWSSIDNEEILPDGFQGDATRHGSGRDAWQGMDTLHAVTDQLFDFGSFFEVRARQRHLHD